MMNFVNITCLFLIKMSSKTPKGYISGAKIFIDNNRMWFLFVNL